MQKTPALCPDVTIFTIGKITADKTHKYIFTAFLQTIWQSLFHACRKKKKPLRIKDLEIVDNYRAEINASTVSVKKNKKKISQSRTYFMPPFEFSGVHLCIQFSHPSTEEPAREHLIPMLTAIKYSRHRALPLEENLGLQPVRLYTLFTVLCSSAFDVYPCS